MRSGWGAHSVSEAMANLALLCPLCNRVPQPRRSVALRRLPWIPACAGMTAQAAGFAWLYPPYIAVAFQGGIETHLYGCDQGACRGAKPLCTSFASPKSGGQRGLTFSFRKAMEANAALLYPLYTLMLNADGVHVPGRVRTPSAQRRPDAAA